MPIEVLGRRPGSSLALVPTIYGGLFDRPRHWSHDCTRFTAVIRQRARDNGLPVGDRGRLSPQLLSAYANSGSSKPQVTIKDGLASAPAPAPRRQARGVRVAVRPTPGATGIAHKVAARSN